MHARNWNENDVNKNYEEQSSSEIIFLLWKLYVNMNSLLSLNYAQRQTSLDLSELLVVSSYRDYLMKMVALKVLQV